MKSAFQLGFGLFAVVASAVSPSFSHAQESWDKAKAIKWLDERATFWLDYDEAQQPADGHGGTVSCFACHTTHTYAFVRPELASGAGATERIYDNIRRRLVSGADVQPWKDKPPTRVAQSRGTEAINAVYSLAMNESREGLKEPSALLITAFERLWKHQRADGGWDWFDFTLEPFATKEAEHFAACQAAIAVGTAPGYYNRDTAEWVHNHVEALRGWLHASRNPDNLFGEAWLLLASTTLQGLLNQQEQQAIVKKLTDKQNQHGESAGSWTLWEMNQWKYSRDEPPTAPRTLHPDARKPEALSTALVTYSLMQSGLAPKDEVVTSALRWLRRNQRADGSWRTYSISKNRSEDDVAFLFLSDEATIWSARVLAQADDYNDRFQSLQRGD